MASKPTIGAKIVLEGEKEYRQALSNCNNTQKVLKSELKVLTAEYANNANSLEALRAKNENLTKQQEEQEKKLALLRGALEKAAELYGENSTQVQNWQIKLNDAYAELQKINRELNDNQKYLKEAEESTNGVAKSIDEYGNKIKEAKEKTLGFGDILKANLASEAIVNGVKSLFNAIRDGSRALVDIVKETAAYADNILTLSVQTGIATDTLQELNYMAELTDTSLETITSTMARNVRSMNSAREGTKLYADAYKSLGVNVIDPVTRQLRDSVTVYWEVIDALGRVANETERDAIAMQIFGRSARDLNPLIAVGKQGVAELADEARRMGAVLSQETLEALGQTDDALQRMYQQLDITKRKIGLEAAPGITEAIEKITDKLDEADYKFAEFASGSINGIIDAFIWIVDNSDFVISGLKGVTAAFATKKAAEGIEYAIDAYKALTSATKAATTAQTALNTASKASVIGTIASVVIGASTALYTYAKNLDEVANASKRNIESIQENIKNREESKKKIEEEYGAIKILKDNLFELANKESKTNDEKREMVTLVEELNRLMPDLNLSIDEHNGLLNMQEEALEKIIDKRLKYNMVMAAQDDLQRIASEKYNTEKTIKDLENKIDEIEKLRKKYDTASSKAIMGYADASLYNRLKGYREDIEEQQKLLEKLDEEYKNTIEYIQKNSSVIEKPVNKFVSSINEGANETVNIVNKLADEINDIYNTASKELDKRLKKERKDFEENQKAQVKTLEDTKKKELKLLEDAHKKKLALIDEEYLEKMKVVDEDRYKALKAIQDQIDAIDAQQEAEDRAAKLKEEAEKRAELQAKISNAKTIEDRMDAQKELQDFEEKVARDRLKTERDLQKDILKEQKEKINDYYDEKVRVIEEEKKKQKEAAEQAYEYDKSFIEQKYRDELEALKKIQEEEKESFGDRQEEYKKYLKEQKDLAIENAKKTYEEDLRLFKLNNALKEKEISKADYIRGIDFGNLKTSDITSGKIQVSSSDLMSYMQYGTPVKPEVAQIKAEFDYNDMVDAFTTALKKLNLTVVLDGKKVGSIVQNTVNKMIN